MKPVASPRIPVAVRKQDWAYQQIRDWVLTGVMEPGEVISQEQLAKALNISRVPLRHALSMLASDGLVIDRPHQRWMVSKISVDDARDVYLGRAALEETLARVAGQNVADADHYLPGLDELQAVMQLQHDAAESGDRPQLLELDRRFHNGIYALARMPASTAALDQLRSRSDRYVAMYLGDVDRAQDSLAEHELILAALCGGDADRAARLTRDHVLGGWCSLVASLEDTTGPNS